MMKLTELDELRRKTAKFASEKLNDNVISRDKNSEFSAHAWKLCADFGILSMAVPQELGGQRMDLNHMASILEGLGYGCKDNGLIFSLCAHLWGVQMPMVEFSSPGQQKKYFPGLCDGSIIGANAMTEPDSGSNIYAMSTTAKKVGDGYILKGAKTFVTNAPVADIFLVYARTGGEGRFDNISCFIVEKGIAGMSVGKPIEKMGLRTSPMAEVF